MTRDCGCCVCEDPGCHALNPLDAAVQALLLLKLVVLFALLFEASARRPPRGVACVRSSVGPSEGLCCLPRAACCLASAISG